MLHRQWSTFFPETGIKPVEKQSLHFESELPNQAACRKQGTAPDKTAQCGYYGTRPYPMGQLLPKNRDGTEKGRNQPIRPCSPAHSSGSPARITAVIRHDSFTEHAPTQGGGGRRAKRCGAAPPHLFHALKQQKKVRPCDLTLKRRLPTLPHDKCSTIGVSELNFSVRNGKRWNLTTITT